jgi:hypothetical protein
MFVNVLSQPLRPLPLGKDKPSSETVTYDVGSYTHGNGEWAWKLG